MFIRVLSFRGGLNKNKMGGLNKCRSLVVRSMVGRGIWP